jgi:hypothetical protein
MATFRTYAEVLGPDHPLMKTKARSAGWSSSRYRSADVDQAMRAEPGVVLGDVFRQAGGAYETATKLTPRFREDIRETAELTSDGELLRIAGLPQVRVSLEHLRQVDPQARILVGYRLDVSLHESPRLSRRLALPPDPRITLHLDEVVFPGTSGRFWSALRWDTPGLQTSAKAVGSAQENAASSRIRQEVRTGIPAPVSAAPPRPARPAAPGPPPAT